MKPSDDSSALYTSLARRYRIVETDVHVGDRSLTILHPASAEELIDETDFERDERLPYWAELWPSSRVLGEHVLQLSGAGRSLLDVGCGSGIVAVCAALAGFKVVASDYYDDAMRFAQLNASKNGTGPIAALHLDWRHLPANLPRFDYVVASDVLYERAYGALMGGVIDATLSPAGEAFVADPGRVARDDFVKAIGTRKLSIRERRDVPFREGPIKQTITLFHIARM